MRPSVVLDCSVAMAWCFTDQATPQTGALLDRMISELAVVPSLWFLEVGNVLIMAEKRGRISPEDSERFMRLMASLDLRVDSETPGRVFSHLVPLCRAFSLTTHDAVYLDVAQRQGLPLATLDQSLQRAAIVAGVDLVFRNP